MALNWLPNSTGADLISSSLINRSPQIFVPMKKRPVKWPLGNPVFVAWEVEAAAGLLVARRNHALVRNGEGLCQGWDLWLDGKFAGALNSRTLSDLATLSREDLLRVTRAACCGRHREFQPDQPRLSRHPKGGFRPNFGRQIAERLAGDIPGTVGIIWLKESAHMPMQEEPEAYTAALLRFLAGELDKR